MGFITTKEAAERLNYSSDAAIRKLIQRKQLTPKKFGRVWLIPEEELDNIKRVRKRYQKRTS